MPSLGPEGGGKLHSQDEGLSGGCRDHPETGFSPVPQTGNPGDCAQLSQTPNASISFLCGQASLCTLASCVRTGVGGCATEGECGASGDGRTINGVTGPPLWPSWGAQPACG